MSLHSLSVQWWWRWHIHHCLYPQVLCEFFFYWYLIRLVPTSSLLWSSFIYMYAPPFNSHFPSCLLPQSWVPYSFGGAMMILKSVRWCLMDHCYIWATVQSPLHHWYPRIPAWSILRPFMESHMLIKCFLFSSSSSVWAVNVTLMTANSCWRALDQLLSYRLDLFALLAERPLSFTYSIYLLVSETAPTDGIVSLILHSALCTSQFGDDEKGYIYTSAYV